MTGSSWGGGSAAQDLLLSWVYKVRAQVAQHPLAALPSGANGSLVLQRLVTGEEGRPVASQGRGGGLTLVMAALPS